MKDQNKNLSNQGKTKTLNKAIQLEDRISRSRSKHEGEPSAEVCDRLSRTRISSQRQLPTDHDYAVPTREYQLDQSSPLPATAAAGPVLDRKKRPAHLDRSLHINFPFAYNPTGALTSGGKADASQQSLIANARAERIESLVDIEVMERDTFLLRLLQPVKGLVIFA